MWCACVCVCVCVCMCVCVCEDTVHMGRLVGVCGMHNGVGKRGGVGGGGVKASRRVLCPCIHMYVACVHTMVGSYYTVNTCC